MIWAVAATGGAALLAVIALAFKLASVSASARSATSETAAARKELADLEVSSAAAIAKTVNERDVALTRAATLATQVADRDAKIATLEPQIADLAAKCARLTIKLAAQLPVSEDGAQAVNDLFSQPLIAKEPK